MIIQLRKILCDRSREADRTNAPSLQKQIRPPRAARSRHPARHDGKLATPKPGVWILAGSRIRQTEIHVARCRAAAAGARPQIRLVADRAPRTDGEFRTLALSGACCATIAAARGLWTITPSDRSTTRLSIGYSKEFRVGCRSASGVPKNSAPDLRSRRHSCTRTQKRNRAPAARRAEKWCSTASCNTMTPGFSSARW